MSQVDERRNSPPLDLRQTLASLYAPIEPELARVDALLVDTLHSDHREADAVIRHGIRLGGKRLRPALVLLAGQAVGELRDEHVTLAAVVEMIHMATLVHDDVLDEAAIRRHEDTVNARWNNETSVLLGDFLFTHAFYLASTLESTYACRTIGRATNTVCDGELRQTLASGDVQLAEDDYLAIVDAKTAELCACCCELGAHYAGGDPDTVARLTTFGRYLGIAFQIADDLLDLEGNESATGKSLGTDLAKCKMTLPLIHARDTLDPRDRKRFLTALASLPLPLGEGRDEGASTAPNHLLPADLIQFARELRKSQTDAESLIWSLLRNRRLGGFKFRRQHPVDRYVLDFYCHEEKLAIELDGGQHNTAIGRSRDEKRTQLMASQGIRVIRFWSHDVLLDTDTVLEAIWNALHVNQTTRTPNPSSKGRGEQVLAAWLARHDSLSYARTQALAYADRAQALLALLPETTAKEALAALADFAVARRG